jgi:repressor LexA
MTIGERIKNRRKELGLTVDEVAERLGKNRATIYRYESNEIESLPSPVLEPLADVLLTTPAYLMGWGDDKKEIAPIKPNRSDVINRINSLPDEQFEKFAAKAEGYLDGLEDR